MQSIARNTCSLRIQKHKVSLFGERYTWTIGLNFSTTSTRSMWRQKSLRDHARPGVFHVRDYTHVRRVRLHELFRDVESCASLVHCVCEESWLRSQETCTWPRVATPFLTLLSDHPLHNVIAGTRDNREILT